MKIKMLIFSGFLMLNFSCYKGPLVLTVVYNNTNEDIIVYVKRQAIEEIAYPIKKKSSYQFSTLTFNKEIVPSSVIDYIKITDLKGDIIAYFKNDSLDKAFIFVEQNERYILYRLDVNQQ